MIPKDEVLKLAKENGACTLTEPNEDLPYSISFGPNELLAFANAIAERASDEQDAEILTGDPSEFFRSRDVADAVRAKWLNNGAATGISYVATLKLDDETRVVSGVIPDDKE